MSVQGVAALIVAITGLVTAIGSLMHSVRVGKRVPKTPPVPPK